MTPRLVQTSKKILSFLDTQRRHDMFVDKAPAPRGGGAEAEAVLSLPQQLPSQRQRVVKSV